MQAFFLNDFHNVGRAMVYHWLYWDCALTLLGVQKEFAAWILNNWLSQASTSFTVVRHLICKSCRTELCCGLHT